MPSGVQPFLVWKFPERYVLIHAGIKVDTDAVKELRSRIPISREECFRWVSDDFDLRAKRAYKAIEVPPLKLAEGWSILMKTREVSEI